MGSVSLFSKPDPLPDPSSTVTAYYAPGILLLKGYILNVANPFSLIFWIGVAGFASKTWGLESHNVALFFAGVFTTAFSTDLLKCYMSGLLRKVLATSALLWINRVMGVVFIGIGLIILYKAGV